MTAASTEPRRALSSSPPAPQPSDGLVLSAHLPQDVVWLVLDEIIRETHWSIMRGRSGCEWQAAFDALTVPANATGDEVLRRYRNMLTAWRRDDARPRILARSLRARRDKVAGSSASSAPPATMAATATATATTTTTAGPAAVTQNP